MPALPRTPSSAPSSATSSGHEPDLGPGTWSESATPASTAASSADEDADADAAGVDCIVSAGPGAGAAVGAGAGAKAKAKAGRFACPTCGHRFRRKNGLSRHMRSHTGEKPFGCSHCQFCSTRPDSLQRHMKLHLLPSRPAAHPYVMSSNAGSGLPLLTPSHHAALLGAGLFDHHPDAASMASDYDNGACSITGTAPAPFPLSGSPELGLTSTASFNSLTNLSSSPKLARDSAPAFPAFLPAPPPAGRQPLLPCAFVASPAAFALAQPPSALASPQPPPWAQLPSHHRISWSAQQHDRGTAPLIIPLPPSHASATLFTIPAPAPLTDEFDLGRLLGSSFVDKAALSFEYNAQAAGLFTSTEAFTYKEQQPQQQQQPPVLWGDERGTTAGDFAVPFTHPACPEPTISTDVGAQVAPYAAEPAPAAPAPNRHLSQFILNFNRHLPFVHVPTIPKLFTDIVDANGHVKLSTEAKQIDCLEPCTEDVLRAMAIVGASYDSTLASPNGFPLVPTASPPGEARSESGLDATPIIADWYGGSELRGKLLNELSARPPSTSRATLAPAGGPDSLTKDFLQEPTLLRRAQTLILLQFASLLSPSHAHRNQARLLHGALITIGRKLLIETAREQTPEHQLSQHAIMDQYEQWRQWARHMERKRTLWAMTVCDQLQSILFHLPPHLQQGELDIIEVASLGAQKLWEAPTASDWHLHRTSSNFHHSESFDYSSRPSWQKLSVVSGTHGSCSLQLALDCVFMDTSQQEQAASAGAHLNPHVNFVTALSLMRMVTEAMRTDTEARNCLRFSAGFSTGTTSELSSKVDWLTLEQLGTAEKVALLSKARKVNKDLSGTVARLEMGIAHWRNLAGAWLPARGSGEAPWVEEGATISCATVHFLGALRARCQPDLSACLQPQPANSDDAELIRLLALPSPTLLDPDQTLRVVVGVRRALRAPDATTALSAWGVGAPISKYGNVPRPAPDKMGVQEPSNIDPSSFRGFFPRLQ